MANGAMANGAHHELDPPNIFEPKNILITGACGFIASHVAIRLVERYPQYKVVVLDKLDYCASLNNLSSVLSKANCKFIKGDIQSMDLVSFVLQAEQIDTVMHFAAQTHVDNSFGNSLAFTMNNTYGTHVMLEAARMTGTIKRFINVSTDEVYGETSLGKEQGLEEQSQLEPTNPYSAAKAGAEMMCKAYMTSYRLPIIITRGNNVYGPHQVLHCILGHPNQQVVSADWALQRSRTVLSVTRVWGGQVIEVVWRLRGAWLSGASLSVGITGEVYNIGTEKERTVLEVARDIAKYFNLPEGKVVHVKVCVNYYGLGRMGRGEEEGGGGRGRTADGKARQDAHRDILLAGYMYELR
eukprot:gene7287-7500_t